MTRRLWLCMGLSAALNFALLALIGAFWPAMPPIITPQRSHIVLLTLLPPPSKMTPLPPIKHRPPVPPKTRRRATPLPPAPYRPPKVAPVAAHRGGARPQPRPAPHLIALPRLQAPLPQSPKAVPAATGVAPTAKPGPDPTPLSSASVGQGTDHGSGKGVGPGTGSAPGPFGIGGTGGGGAGPRHVVYLLDISGSMAMTEGVFGGQSRLQRAREELDRQLGSLGPGETFSMIAFADGTLLFRPQLVSATAANVQDAERFLDGLTPDGDTDLEDALDAALAMPGVNVVYVITDGVPRTPDHDYTKPKDFDALASRIDNANRQNARVFAIGLLGPNPDGTDESAQASALLEQIASDSGGTFKPISLDDAPQDSGKP